MGGSLADTEAQAIFCFSPHGKRKDIFPQQVLHPKLLRSRFHPLNDFFFRQALIFTSKGQFAGRVHRKKLRAGILKNAPHIFCRFIERKGADVFSIQQDFAAQLAS